PTPLYCTCGARIGERLPDGTLVMYFRHHGERHQPKIKGSAVESPERR
ncbi:hypothetical protein LCGC14_2612110, partial [marine sediment metagenome]